jgi:hypothetical protein
MDKVQKHNSINSGEVVQVKVSGKRERTHMGEILRIRNFTKGLHILIIQGRDFGNNKVWEPLIYMSCETRVTKFRNSL